MQTAVRDLVEEISIILERNNHPSPRAWVNSLHTDAINHPDDKIRRFQINQFWRTNIGRVDLQGLGNTIGERFFLTEEGSVDNWLRLFELKIVPTIIKYRIGFPLDS